jgi:RNA polymerase sigma-70 factor (ECF subfamily)
VIATIPRVGEFIEMTATRRPVGLAELFERHADAVFRAAFRITGNPADAEDALQTVFLRVLSQPSLASASDGEPSRPSPADARDGAAGPRGHDPEASSARSAAYFRRAAVNAAVDLLRRRAVQAATAYDDEAPHARVESAPLLKEQLRRAITTLDSDDASLFLLRYVEGFSNQELADLFQLEKNNVAVRLHRIRMRLQAELEK